MKRHIQRRNVDSKTIERMIADRKWLQTYLSVVSPVVSPEVSDDNTDKSFDQLIDNKKQGLKTTEVMG